jgi:hypothetical protein
VGKARIAGKGRPKDEPNKYLVAVYNNYVRLLVFISHNHFRLFRLQLVGALVCQVMRAFFALLPSVILYLGFLSASCSYFTFKAVDDAGGVWTCPRYRGSQCRFCIHLFLFWLLDAAIFRSARAWCFVHLALLPLKCIVVVGDVDCLTTTDHLSRSEMYLRAPPPSHPSASQSCFQTDRPKTRTAGGTYVQCALSEFEVIRGPLFTKTTLTTSSGHTWKPSADTLELFIIFYGLLLYSMGTWALVAKLCVCGILELTTLWYYTTVPPF